MGKACPSFELLSAYRDSETTPAETALVARHLPGCPECQATISGFERLASALFASPAIACDVALPLLSAQMDAEATAPELALVAHHLSNCASCEARRVAWESVDRLIASLPEAFPSPAADAKIRALAIHTRAARPSFTRAFASLAVVMATVALAFYSSLSAGIGKAPQLGVGGGDTNGQTIVASVAQQVYNPSTGLLYVLEPAPKAAVVVRDAGQQRDLKTILLGGAPAFMAINASAKTLYVVDPVARSYTDIDTELNEIRARVPLNVTGTPTSIAVDSETGRLVVATEPAKTTANATAPAATPKPEIAVIDPSSKKLETVKQVDVAPTRIVVDQDRGRLFLLGPNSTTVLDATTYDTVDTISGSAVAVAIGNKGPAILSDRGGHAVLTFYRSDGEASFAGRAAGLFALRDGGFAVLVEDAAGGRIVLTNADGGDRGQTFNVPSGVRGLAFDAERGRFIAATGGVVAQIEQGGIVGVTTTPSPAPTSAVTAPPTASPAPTASPVPATTPTAGATNGGTVSVPSTPAPTLFPGAELAATGLYRYELPGNFRIAAMAAGDDGRLWAAGRDGSIRSISTKNGGVQTWTYIAGANITRIAYSSGRVFALDQHGKLFILNTADGRLSGADVPFGRSVVAMSFAPSGVLWIASSDYNGLIAYDPRTTQFSIVYLDPGSAPSALAVDGAGRVWFTDASRHTLGVYEPGVGRMTYSTLPTSDRVVALYADGRSNIWLGTDRGAILRSSVGAIETVSTAGRAVLAFVPSGTGVAVLIDAGQSTLAGTPGGTLTVASGAIDSIASDSAGRLWLADSQRAVIYIAEAE